MTGGSFRIVAGAADWGSPLSEQPSFATLEEARAAAREYVAEQKRVGAAVLGKIVIEETRPDGGIVTHAAG